MPGGHQSLLLVEIPVEELVEGVRELDPVSSCPGEDGTRAAWREVDREKVRLNEEVTEQPASGARGLWLELGERPQAKVMPVGIQRPAELLPKRTQTRWDDEPVQTFEGCERLRTRSRRADDVIFIETSSESLKSIHRRPFCSLKG